MRKHLMDLDPMASAAAAAPLGPILQHLRSEPSRTWTIVVTIFGDAVVPRGGSFWLGSLLEIFAGMEIAPGVVRTAMSRLAADGWLQRSRIGRNSFYSLTPIGRARFAPAAVRIYGGAPDPWEGRLQLLLSTESSVDETTRTALEGAGFGGLGPNLWVAPLSAAVPAPAASMIPMDTRVGLRDARALAQRAWPLERTAQAYRGFIDVFAPLRSWIVAGGTPADLDSLVARTLLVHGYRRVVLRDPLLPSELLPAPWPGTAARQLCSDIYQALLTPSEHWMDLHGRGEAGVLPQPSENLRRRFERHDAIERPLD